MKKFLRYTICFLILSMLFFTVGCGQSNTKDQGAAAQKQDTSTASKGKVSLTFWHAYTPDKETVLKEMLKKYTESNPNVEIKPQFIAAGEEMLTKIQASLASNTLPDFAWGAPTWTGALASSGKIVNLTSMIDENLKKDYMQGLLDANRYKGDLYSVPVEAGTLVLIYNKEMFKAAGIEKPPVTWTELVDVSKKLTKDGQYGIWVPIEPGERTTWTWLTFLWSAGGQLLNSDESKAAFGDEKGLEALKMYTDLVKQHKAAPDGITAKDNPFENKKVAMVIATQGAANSYVTKFKMDIGVAPLPKKDKEATGLGSNVLYLFKSTPEKEKASWEYMKWFSTGEVNAEWVSKTGYLPVTNSGVNSNFYKKYGQENPLMLTAAEILKNGYARPNGAYYGKISDAISGAIGKIVYNGEDAQKALESAVETANKALKQ